MKVFQTIPNFSALGVALITIIGSLLLLTPRSHAQAGMPLWTNAYDSGFSDVPNASGVDRDGDIFVTGYSADSISGYGVTIKYSNSGVPLWTNRFSGGSANALAVDANGNAFITGSGRDNNDNLAYTTIKYSSSGVPVWTNLYNEGNNDGGVATAIAVDNIGNVFVTGYGGQNATVAYSNSGVPLWTNRGGNSGIDYLYAIAVDPTGNVFVTGQA